MKSFLVTLISLAIISICQAAEPKLHTHITRGDDKIVYSGGKEGLRAILLSFLKLNSNEPVSIFSAIHKEVGAKDQQTDLEMKSRTHSFEVVNGFHRFTVLPDDPKDKVFAITADQSLEVAVRQFVDSLYKLAK
jgi:hypothetical protein